MADREIELLLSSFGEYLLRNGLTDQRHGPYFVGWIRRYLGMVPRIPDATPNESLTLFIDSLQRAQTPDWQVEQARQAITAWFGWRDQAQRAAPAPKASVAPDGTVPRPVEVMSGHSTLRG